MGTCKTCRWWGPNQPGFDARGYSNQQGVCVCPKVHFATTRIDDDCSEHLVDAKTDHALESDEVGVKDGSGYFAAMFTGPDFGCCHHQPLTKESTCTGYHVRSTQGEELWIDSLGFSSGSSIGFQTRRCTRQEADNLIGKTFGECLSALTRETVSDNNSAGE